MALLVASAHDPLLCELRAVERLYHAEQRQHAITRESLAALQDASRLARCNTPTASAAARADAEVRELRDERQHLLAQLKASDELARRWERLVGDTAMQMWVVHMTLERSLAEAEATAARSVQVAAHHGR